MDGNFGTHSCYEIVTAIPIEGHDHRDALSNFGEVATWTGHVFL